MQIQRGMLYAQFDPMRANNTSSSAVAVTAQPDDSQIATQINLNNGVSKHAGQAFDDFFHDIKAQYPSLNVFHLDAELKGDQAVLKHADHLSKPQQHAIEDRLNRSDILLKAFKQGMSFDDIKNTSSIPVEEMGYATVTIEDEPDFTEQMKISRAANKRMRDILFKQHDSDEIGIKFYRAAKAFQVAFQAADALYPELKLSAFDLDVVLQDDRVVLKRGDSVFPEQKTAIEALLNANDTIKDALTAGVGFIRDLEHLYSIFQDPSKVNNPKPPLSQFAEESLHDFFHKTFGNEDWSQPMSTWKKFKETETYNIASSFIETFSWSLNIHYFSSVVDLPDGMATLPYKDVSGATFGQRINHYA